MLSSIRVPISRSSSQYVCLACRAQRVASPQQLRSLSTGVDTEPLPPKLPPTDYNTSSSETKNSGNNIKSDFVHGNWDIDENKSGKTYLTEERGDASASSANLFEGTGHDDNSKEKTLLGKQQPVVKRLRQAGVSNRRKRQLQKRGSLSSQLQLAAHKRKISPTFEFTQEGTRWAGQLTLPGKVVKTQDTYSSKRDAKENLLEIGLKYLESISPPAHTDTLKHETEQQREGSQGQESNDFHDVFRKILSDSTKEQPAHPTSLDEAAGKTDVQTPTQWELHRTWPEEWKRRSEVLANARAFARSDHPFSAEEASLAVAEAETIQSTSDLPKDLQAMVAKSEEVKSLTPRDLQIRALDITQPQVPRLSFGLDRVLFNRGVYRLRDPRSRVYNFDPYLEKIIPPTEFNFAALGKFRTASKDQDLVKVAKENDFKFFTSTSSLTGVLQHFHFLISNWRQINVGMLSKDFNSRSQTSFTNFTRAPASVFLKPQGGCYAIDRDDATTFAGNTLPLVGRSLEKLFTVPKDTFERYLKSHPSKASSTTKEDGPGAHHYTGVGHLLVRSQLDAYDPRLPGSGVFDIKTRAVLPVRMDGDSQMEVATSYEIKSELGDFESFEREHYDMVRAPMLKYSLQARLGRMDGIFVAYHNVSRLFGFQYLTVEEMDSALHGQKDPFLGDQELRASIQILQDALDRAVKRFPGQPLRVHFETRARKVPFMYIFVEPVTTEEVEAIQEMRQRKAEEHERAVLDPLNSISTEADPAGISDEQNGWREINDIVREEIGNDKMLANVETSSYEVDNLDIDEALSQLQSTAIDLFSGVSELKQSLMVEMSDNDKKRQLDVIIRTTAELETGVLELTNSLPKEGDHGGLFQQIDRLRDVVGRQRKENIKLRAQIGENEELSTESDVDPDDAEILERPSTPQKDRGEILTMALTVRNKINGGYVEGSPEPQKDDDWVIEYCIQELSDKEQEWDLYKASRDRLERASIFGRDERSMAQWQNSNFMQELRYLSEKGKEWRIKQDMIDAETSQVVFEPGDTSSR